MLARSGVFMVRGHSEQVRGKARMVINYVKLSQAVKDDAYRIPIKDEQFSRLRDRHFFSKMDCKSGFYQMKMEEDSIQYTALSCCLGSYEWLVMPMGYKNAPSIFQRRMDSILGEFSDFCMVYIDDILIFSRTQEDHHEHLKLVAQKLRDNGVILSKN
ncbi:hypothetical protein Q3G72_015277 [Acer saccharum]|nr:hypothetical protein Q3G72_015277 [Acer saccharum]